MPPVVPAMNTIWFWFHDEADRRRLHGTPQDAMRKFLALDAGGCLDQGLEIFLVPDRLPRSPGFEPWFYRKFSALGYKTVHIGDGDPFFLTAPDQDRVCQSFRTLAVELDRLETDTVIIHAHHFRENRELGRKRLAETLPGVKILIENNGFDNDWGKDPSSLLDIFHDCPEFGFCLDLAHVKDYPDLRLTDFIGRAELEERIGEIHLSYSTHLLPSDPYEARGYPGYGPFHALFSVIGSAPSARTVAALTRWPMVLEGIVPEEDRGMDFLKQEVRLASGWSC